MRSNAHSAACGHFGPFVIGPIDTTVSILAFSKRPLKAFAALICRVLAYPARQTALLGFHLGYPSKRPHSPVRLTGSHKSGKLIKE